MSIDAHTDKDAARWRKMLVEGHKGKVFWNRLMRLIPSAPRCKTCNNPFAGVGGFFCRSIGMKPSKKNPRICALCCEKMPRGGAEVETTILFADIRGSTELAEKLGPEAFAEALNRFYLTATETLIRHDATVDKLIGDEVMAFFVPGFTGPDFKHIAIEAGRELLEKLGYGPDGDPRLPVGIGIESGIAFVGNVGGEDFVDFTVLGDPVNVAARIQAAAKPGQLLVGDGAFAAVSDFYPDTETFSLTVKGKQAPITVHSVPVANVN